MIHKQMTKGELKHKYESMKVTDLIDELGMNCKSFYELLDSSGIERKVPNRKRRTPMSERVVVEIVD